MKNFLQPVSTMLGLILALGLTLALLSPDPLGSMMRLGQGAFGDWLGVTRTLVKWTPLTLAGLGVVVAWRSGMYNIGGEGQFVVGGLCGAFVARPFLQSGLPWWAMAILVLGAAIAGGALWGWLAAWLFHKRKVDVVISTILLNFIAIQGLAYFVSGPLMEAAHKLPQSDRIPSEMALPKFNPAYDVHYGVFLAALAIVLIYIYLQRSKPGFRLRLVGENSRAARANWIEPERTRSLAMALSGGLCGLAGGVEYLGSTQQLGLGFSQNWGFLAIPVALLAGLNPILVGLSALYFAAILGGSKNLAGFTVDGTAIIYVVQAIAVLGLVAIKRLSRPQLRVTESA